MKKDMPWYLDSCQVNIVKNLSVNMTAPISSQDLEHDDDYTGGEFVLTQQIPRAQSKAIVLRPRRGIG
jgi:hypothetical protein